MIQYSCFSTKFCERLYEFLEMLSDENPEAKALLQEWEQLSQLKDCDPYCTLVRIPMRHTLAA